MNRWMSLIVVALLIPSSANALCAAQDMEGRWVNENPDSRSFARVDIEFPCYDTAGQSGPEAVVHVFGVCHPYPCDWGETNASYSFLALESGWPQYTRVDAVYNIGSAVVNFVILRLAADRLLVYSSQDFVEGIALKDLSRIDYFRPMNRWVNIDTYPPSPKQGDRVAFVISAGDASGIERINYTVNNLPGALLSPPYRIDFDTCKSSGDYHTDIALEGQIIYTDGEIVPFGAMHGLTVGRNAREDQDRSFAFYVAEDGDQGLEDRNIDRANAFIDEFDTYAEAQYFFAEPEFYTNAAVNFANSVDLALSIGHGNHHVFFTGNGMVDMTDTAFGNFAPCYQNGDLEYLAFVSCETLSMQTIGGTPFVDFWVHNGSTAAETRPFTGLHMVLGFASDIHFRHWLLDDNGEDFLRAFARYLDRGWKVKDAWLYAADDELPVDSSQNRAAALYMEVYEHDRLSTVKDDYIYGHPNYGRFFIEHW